MSRVTATGYQRTSFDEELVALKTAVRGSAHQSLTLDVQDPLGALLAGVARRLSLADEAVEAAYNAIDPDNADDFAAENQAAMLGVLRNAATYGTVVASCDLDAGFYAAGSLTAHVLGEATNRWVSSEDVTSTGGANDVEFTCESSGVQQALAGTLTIKADGGASGWNSITNASDATPGSAIEEIGALILRKNQRLAQLGSSGLAAIKSAVEQVDGVIGVRAQENEALTTDGDGLPGKSIRITVYDGASPAADDDEIATAILAYKVEGIESYGGESGDALDTNGESRPVAFERATVTQLWCNVTVTAPDGADAAAIKLAILAAMPVGMSQTIYVEQLKAAVLAVAGVVDVTVFQIEDTDPPTATVNLTSGAIEAFSLDSSDIDVTIT